jgi:Est1 DNA/RNA binding domain
MAVEDEDPKDREIWANVARYWYCKAADKMPNTGRLYHHLAILARGNPLQQLYLYSRSLTSAQPFASARESIQSLLEPAIKEEKQYFPEIDICFVKVHALLFYRKFDAFPETLRKFHSLLDPQINKLTAKWREYGVYIAASNIGAMFDFGQRNFLTQAFEIGNFLSLNTSIDSEEQQARLQKLKEPIVLDEAARQSFKFSTELFFSTLQIILQRPYDKNIQPFLHVSLSFVQTLLSFRKDQCWEHLPENSKYVVRQFLRRTPWQSIADASNTSIKQEEFGSKFESLSFLQSEKNESSCLPEDYLLWGLLWTQAYYPPNHFDNANADEERSIELPSTMHMRIERNLHITYKLARENVSSLIRRVLSSLIIRIGR